MGLTAKRLAAVIGASEPTVSRMKAGAFVLDAKGKPYELAVLLIRLFRSLDAIAGGETRVLRQWLVNPNTVLGGKPIDKLETISGLTDVLAYLDARRALV
ncbi:MAG: MbcA/ParS/Xre antitoxin family protein [Alphaproteobacteria bacterium]|nr:MbcA/ParS/Xre antitoxin family protein [Alphaproteobacteria bacterium]MBU1561710.1 MbcA/ParS/Xre antitoxin family protein [Alphaproteobacteria bacterium]MBU2303016.1 MbcA/ParS/Xre antitoxin family protein [Alphaproteobacteria bacterium]MBU2368802.1 MbcA/ParS/Xre antitoxin family protein [Alphaproteobacteria bacterium]